MPLMVKVWPATLLSSRTVPMAVLPAGGAVSLVSSNAPEELPLRSTVVVAIWVMSTLTVPGCAVLPTVALPTVVLEEVAVWVLNRVEVKFCNSVLSTPRLVPRAPTVVLLVFRSVSSVWRLVMGMLSAAMIDWIIDETFKPLKVPPIVTLINRR